MNLDEAAIRDLVASWCRASERGDLAALESMLAPDMLFLTVGNEPFGREQFRAGFTQAIAAMQITCRAEVREVNLLGNFAQTLTWVEVHLRPRSGGDTEVRQSYAMSVFRRSEAGQWQMWRDASLMLN